MELNQPRIKQLCTSKITSCGAGSPIFRGILLSELHLLQERTCTTLSEYLRVSHTVLHCAGGSGVYWTVVGGRY